MPDDVRDSNREVGENEILQATYHNTSCLVTKNERAKAELQQQQQQMPQKQQQK